MYGLTDEEVAAVRQGAFGLFPEAEAVLLRMADAMADTPAAVSDELYSELRRYHSEEQLIELAASAAQENYRARFNRVFDVESDHLYRAGMIYKKR
jgi:alkylhydroperoxidase family enzyme